MSGALRHFLFAANVWTEAGHQADFLCARCAFPQIGGLCPNSRLISSDNLFDATSYVEKTARYFPAYGWRMVTPRFTRLPEKYDVVIASTQLIVEAYPAMILARRLGAKFVAKVHHVLHAQHGESRANFIGRLFLWSERRTTRWFNRGADLVICGTKFVERDYNHFVCELGLTPARNTTAIGYGIDLSAFANVWDPPRPREFDAAHLGRMHQHKGVLDLPHVWKEVVEKRPGARLLVIGEGPHRQACADLCKELGIAGNVHFTGGIPEAEKNRLLASVRVGLSLSYEEGWGLSINEFLALGLPVVAYHLPIFDAVFPEQLTQVPLGDKSACAQALVRLLADEPRQRSQGLKGREFVQRYDYRNVAREELEAMQRLF